jgi:periplasmic protein TonB
MLTRTDLITGAIALTVHAGIAYALVRVPPRAAKTRTTVEVEFRKAKPPPRKEPPPPTPATPAPPLRREAARPSLAAAPAVEPKARAPEPAARPVYGVSLDSLGDASGPGIAVPVGNTPALSAHGLPRPKGPVLPLPPPAPPKPKFQPVSELRVKSKPVIDAVACGRSVVYPPEAQRLGLEGEVRLRVSLDESGRVVEVKVVSGLGHGLDEAAVNAIKNRCRFTPAFATDGKPVPFVIPAYVFRFELPR